MATRFRISEVAPFYRGGALRDDEIAPGVWIARFKARLFGCLMAIDESEEAADQDIIIDILRNGSSVFGSTTQRPRILAGSYFTEHNFEPLGVIINLSRGDRIRPKIIQAGTPDQPGFGLTIEIEYSYTE